MICFAPRNFSVDSRWFTAHFAAIPLLAVGEVLLIGSLDLLHSANVGAATNKRQKIHLNRLFMGTDSPNFHQSIKITQLRF